MSKLKRLTLVLVSILLIMVVSVSSVNAESRYISYEDLCSNEKLLCVQRNQKMYGGDYDLKYTIEILGDTSTGNGKTAKSWHNAKLASILSNERGQAEPDYDLDVAVLPVQNAIWSYFPEWMKEVGEKEENGHGISDFETWGPAYDNRGDEILSKANEYADNYDKSHVLKDKTDKTKIQVLTYLQDGENFLKVGPFKYEFSGELTEIKLDTLNTQNIDVDFIEKKINENTFEKYAKLGDVKSNDEIYLNIKMPTDGIQEIKKVKVKSKTDEKYVKINFWQEEWGEQQNLIEYEYSTKPLNIENEFDYDIKLFGNLKVIKVNKDNETIKLANVGFFIQNKDTGKYVNKENNVISYKESIADATEFITDSNGEISINNLIVGTYVAYETKNPNYGYEIISGGQEKQVTIDKTAELKIPNKQKFIKLSGYVWVDKITGKQSTRNDLYHDGEYDSKDMLLDGITVRLKNRETNEIVKETITANGGAYKFVDVLVDDLGKYYVEFEYDGVTYTNVVAHTDKDNGSKSAENENVRTRFNNDFAVVEGKSSNTSITRDDKGNEKHTITYNIENNIATVDKTKSYYGITANTDETGYKIIDHFTYGQEEIKYINLGLYEREMPDMRMQKDVENVELSINGFNHVYGYGSRKLDNYTVEKDETGFNGTYKRAIYEPDYNYTLANQDKDNKLNVYLTYRIAMYNESTTLKTRINSIVDYFDKNFTIEKIGTGINKETGEITGNITIPQVEESGNYNKIVIQNNTELEAEKTSSIYVRFKLSDSEVLQAINDRGEITYKNIAEINSYSIFDKNGKIYAGIDKDAAPANSVPGDVNTYEDDTNQAPGIELEVQGNRSLSGSVFLDESQGGIAQVRLGDGIFDTTKEHGIAGVKVTLKEDKENGQEYTSITDENGNFTVKDFIPGNYTLTYTWGDQIYNVNDYKGTIWITENRNEKQQNGTSWHKVNVETRYSDAMDNWETRQKIDGGDTTITTMNSTTPVMALNVEVNSVYSTVSGDTFIPEGYEIKNVDFGIVERAREQLEIVKRIKSFKVTLARGQVIVDATVDENGNLVGSTNNVIYMKPGVSNPINGQIWLQIDNELLQGAKVEVGYEIKVVNNSELDYDTQGYYYFGEERNNVITITPTGVYDYLDGMVLDEDKKNENSKWEVISKTEYNNKYKDPTIVEQYFIDGISNETNLYQYEVVTKIYETIYEEWASAVLEGRTVRDAKLSDKTILHNADLEKEIQPGQENKVDLYTSVDLANSNEIDLNNTVEITEYKESRQSGRKITPRTASLIDKGQEITVTPPTGENNNYILIITTAVVALVILGVGIIWIKKKTI